MRLQVAGDVTYSEEFSGKVDPGVVEVLKGGYSVVNLEGPITSYRRSARKSVVISQPPAAAPALAAIGVKAASLANNHIMDHLARGLMDTIEVLGSLGIAHFGAGRNLAEASAPLRVGEFSLIGFATTLPPGFEAGPETPGVSPLRVKCYYELDPDEAREQPGVQPRVRCRADAADVRRISHIIRREKDAGRYVVLVAHWGIANQRSPLRYQRELARRLVGAGADLIVGAHPHGLVGHEVIGRAHVFYGVGALILRPSFNYPLPKVIQSAIVRAEPAAGGLDVEPVPLVLEGGYPRKPSRDEESAILETLGWI